jgi:hypothetical protein
MPRLLDGYRLDVSGDKADDEKRIARYKMVKDSAPKSAAYQNDPAFKAMVDVFLDQGQVFSTDLDNWEKAKHAAGVAETTADNSRTAYDAAYDVVGQGLLARSAGVEDIKACGFTAVAQEPTSREVTMLSGLTVKFDPVISAIKVYATFPDKGRHQIYLEISPDPIGPSTFRRLDTTGIRQVLRGYAPGLWWIRAAAFRARMRSDWFGPVSVLVK